METGSCLICWAVFECLEEIKAPFEWVSEEARTYLRGGLSELRDYSDQSDQSEEYGGLNEGTGDAAEEGEVDEGYEDDEEEHDDGEDREDGGDPDAMDLGWP